MILINMFVRASLFLALLSLSPLEAHGTCEDCVSPRELAQHSALLFNIVLEELVADVRQGRAPEVLIMPAMKFESPNFLGLIKLKLVRDPRFYEALQRSLKRYHEVIEGGAALPHEDLLEVSRSWIKQRGVDLQLVVADGATQVAKFGILFGVGWAIFELVEHSLTPFLPPGLGFLCATFPVLWAVTLGPLVEPIGFMKANPEAERGFKRVLRSTTLPLRKFQFNRSLKRLRIGNSLNVRQGDQDFSTWPYALQVLNIGPYWFQTQSFYAQRVELFGSRNLAASPLASFKDVQKSLESGHLTEDQAFQIYEMMTLPLQFKREELAALYRSKGLNFSALIKVKFQLGRLDRAADRIFRILFHTAQIENIERGASHALALEGLLSDYYSILQDFVIDLGSEARTPGFKSKYREFSKKILTMERGNHVCKAALIRISFADL